MKTGDITEQREAEYGGIDLTADQTNLQVQNAGEAITFNIDPVMLAKFQNAIGFEPVIIHIKPLESIPSFLGIPTAA
jgi:hypothetical protein